MGVYLLFDLSTESPEVRVLERMQYQRMKDEDVQEVLLAVDLALVHSCFFKILAVYLCGAKNSLGS